MYESGVVQSVSGKIVQVKCGTPSSCHSCKSPLCSRKDRIIPTRNSNNFPLEPGDEVEFYIAPGKTIFESFIVLMLPLFLFILFFVAGEFVFHLDTEFKKVLCGIIGIGNGFLIALFYSRMRKNKDIPVITRKW